MGPTVADFPELGSLAQSVRRQQLFTIRKLLCALGLGIILGHLGAWMRLPEMVHQAQIDNVALQQAQARAQGRLASYVQDEQQLKDIETHLVRVNALYNGGAIATGVLLGVLGIVVLRFPSRALALGLVLAVLYIAGGLLATVLTPFHLTGFLVDLVFKFLVVMMLIQGLHVALAYQADLQAADVSITPGP